MTGPVSYERTVWFPVYNDSGETVPSCAVLHPDAWVLHHNQAVLKIKKPNTGNVPPRWAINSKAPIKTGGYGWATYSPTYIFYDTSSTPAMRNSWGGKPGEWKAYKGYFGINSTDLYSSGTARMFGETRFITKLLGKTDASHAKGASGTVSIYVGTQGSETDSTINVTAYNKFADVATTKWVWVEFEAGGWYLTAAEC